MKSPSEMKQHYVSGIRPTGRLHLGNYLGAIKQWRELPGTYFVADLHGEGNTIATLVSLAKLGIEAERESHHAANILNIQHLISRYVGVGRLERMTQYKDKCETEQAKLSLLAYPVLMTADIFYFGGTHIPVGADQVQHIEFARDMTDILAHHGHHFAKPEIVLSPSPRIMSLTDASKKMSKSSDDIDGCIYIDDTADEIRRKIMGAKTTMNIINDTPEMRNLHAIYTALGGKEEHTRFKPYKEEIAELIIKEFTV